MRIALRTGAGRGAYELAGKQGEYSASALFDKEMFYELTPNLVIPGYAVPALRQGKPRIKLDDDRGKDAAHFYLLLAALLLLPEPRREFRKTGGSTLLADKAYSMTVIKIDVVTVAPFRTVVRPTEILLQNAQGRSESMDFVSRMSRIIGVWDVANNTDSRLAELLRHHQAVFQASKVSHLAIRKAAKLILDYLGIGSDPLLDIESRLGLDQGIKIEELVPISHTEEFGINDVVPPEIAQIENVRKWRKAAARDSAAHRFSLVVKEYYRDTCLFTGQRLPKLNSILSSGVDAAHILPWASHGINSINNGICLSKQSHWAFDSGVIKFSFDRSSDQYIISIPETVFTEAGEAGFSLAPYQEMVGAIPSERLPTNPDLWPNPDYIDAYNEIMFS